MTAAFWLAALVLAVLKLWLVSDLTLQIVYTPADDTAYVLRAWHLLRGEGYGPYDATLLVKYPGLSLWIAAMHELGLPLLLSINLLYLGAGLYLAGALLACGARRWLVLLSFALYAFNPVTFGSEWIRPIREPLSTGLLALMVGAMAHMLAAHRAGRRPWGHLALFTLAFAFSLFVREEDRLLWGMLALFTGALAWQATGSLPRAARPRGGALAFAAAAFIVPGLAGKAYEHALREFAERHYGLPMLHEFGEGEYPPMLAAIRGIRSAKDNRMVLLPQETIEKLRREVPEFAPVAAQLPRPGPRTFSCQLQGVCSEWSNGWMPFWIKEEAFRAGLTPTLVQAQAYFRQVRMDIERACASGRLECSPHGSGIVAPMELRWTRAYVAETWRLLKWALGPEVGPLAGNPTVYDVPLEIGRIYRDMTGARFDDRLQSGYGAPASAQGRASAFGLARLIITPVHRLACAFLLLAAFAALLWRCWTAGRAAPDALALTGMVFGAFLLGRLAILGWLAVSMGQFAPRIVFATYSVALLVALPFAAGSLRALRRGEGTPA